jgi:hypothetical protein
MKTFKAYLTMASCIICLMVAAPTEAHHSVASEFDVKKLVPMSGVLTKVEMIMPHPWMYLDIKGPDGKVNNWEMEFTLRWRPKMKVGDTYKVIVAPAKTKRYRAFVVELTFPDGKKFSRASTPDS